MNQPTPAIVAQSAVRRLPRLALLLFCAAYVLPGFIGRGPWKNQDIMALGYMWELAQGHSHWLQPTLLGQPPEFDALLPYWLGAWAIQIAPHWIAPDFAARIPFILLLVVTFLATWYGVYYLARTPDAQPVPFAFGGEARPRDYARAIADGGLLALMACLGLMQLSHETTPALAQLGFTALTFYGLAALPYRLVVPAIAVAVGLLGLSLSGAPSMAMLFALGGAVLHFADAPTDAATESRGSGGAVLVILLASAAAAVAAGFQTWHWRLGADPGEGHHELMSVVRLVAWFAWPAWPLALWTVARWRRHLLRRHVALPLWFALVSLATTFLAPNADRALLLGLPALATLAAFALPTFSRSAAALIDWFTLLFFSACAVFVWVMWIAIQTGFPPAPARNVARLAPGFIPSFSLLPFVVAGAASLAWVWLVRWRTSRNRAALWKSLVLPAGGTALCWVLVTTLWLPVLDYARSYYTVAEAVRKIVPPGECVEAFGLSRVHAAALRFHADLDLRSDDLPGQCNWLIATQELEPSVAMVADPRHWKLVATVRRPTDPKDNLILYRKR